MMPNKTMDELIDSTIQWHKDRNLIEGATDWTQTSKLLEEFIELVAAQMPGAEPHVIWNEMHNMINELYHNGRIKSVTEAEANDAKKDALGDMDVVMINIATRNKWTKAECLESSYNEIKDRKGKMINGSFVKEADL